LVENKETYTNPTDAGAINEKIDNGDVKVQGKRNKSKRKTAKSPKKEKAKEPPQQVEPKNATFPVEHKINAYGFIGLHKDWLAALGWTKPMAIKISLTEDAEGLIIRRKEG